MGTLRTPNKKDQEKLLRSDNNQLGHISSFTNQFPLNETTVISPFTAGSTSLHQIFSSSQSQPPKRKSSEMEPSDAADQANQAIGMILRQMQQDKTDILSEIQAGRTDTVKRIESLRLDVDSKFSGVDRRVTGIESSLNVTNESINNIQLKLDELEQARLATQMDITGLSTTAVTSQQKDARTLAHEIISSFGITIQLNELQHAFTRSTGPDKTILVVVFASIQSKSFVMREKRKIKDDRKIYFDHRLTPNIRTLFWSARSAVKVKRAKSAYIASGRVMLEKFDGSKVTVRSIKDLDTLTPQATATQPHHNHQSVTSQPLLNHQSVTTKPQHNQQSSTTQPSHNHQPFTTQPHQKNA